AKLRKIKPTAAAGTTRQSGATQQGSAPTNQRRCLFDFDSRARVGELLPDSLRFFLGHALFDGLWSSFDEVLRFFQTKRGNFANHLDDVDLVTTRGLKNDIELRLFLSWSRCFATGSCRWCRGNRSCCGHAEGLFHQLHEL